MTSVMETYPTITAQEADALRLQEQLERKNYASEEVTGELGHLAIAMVTGGTVDADTLPRAEYARQQETTADLDAQFAMEAVAERDRTIRQNIGAVAALDTMYGYTELRAASSIAEQQAALEYANRSQYGLTA